MEDMELFLTVIASVVTVVVWVCFVLLLQKAGKRKSNKFFAVIQEYRESEEPKKVFLFGFVESFLWLVLISVVDCLICHQSIPIWIDILVCLGLALVFGLLRVFYFSLKKTKYNNRKND